jgi:hypothetical protein
MSYVYFSLHGIPRVTELENEILVSSFMEEEVKKAIFQMEHNKAPGPDGFQPSFIKYFGMLSKTAYYLSSMSFTRDIFLYLALTLGLLHYSLSKRRLNKFNNLDPYASLT